MTSKAKSGQRLKAAVLSIGLIAVALLAGAAPGLAALAVAPLPASSLLVSPPPAAELAPDFTRPGDGPAFAEDVGAARRPGRIGMLHESRFFFQTALAGGMLAVVALVRRRRHRRRLAWGVLPERRLSGLFGS